MDGYLCTPNQKERLAPVIKGSKFLQQWEHSSAGLEHLPYKQRVRGSNPCAPTQAGNSIVQLDHPLFFLFKTCARLDM